MQRLAQFRAPTPGVIEFLLVVDGDLAIYTFNRKGYSISLVDRVGRLLWSRTLGGEFIWSMASDSGSLFLAPERHISGHEGTAELLAVRKADGAFIRYPLPMNHGDWIGPISASGGTVVAEQGVEPNPFPSRERLVVPTRAAARVDSLAILGWNDIEIVRGWTTSECGEVADMWSHGEAVLGPRDAQNPRLRSRREVETRIARAKPWTGRTLKVGTLPCFRPQRQVDRWERRLGSLDVRHIEDDGSIWVDAGIINIHGYSPAAYDAHKLDRSDRDRPVLAHFDFAGNVLSYVIAPRDETMSAVGGDVVYFLKANNVIERWQALSLP